MSEGVRLKVSEAASRDVGRGLIRMDPADLTRLGLKLGDFVEVEGKRCTLGKVMIAYADDRGHERAVMDGVMRDNARTGLGERVIVRPAKVFPAKQVSVISQTAHLTRRDLDYIGSRLDGLPVRQGDRIRVTLFGSRWADFQVESTLPPEAVVIHPTTRLVVGEAKPQKAAPQGGVDAVPSYEDIGGLKPQLQRIREMIELPLRYPEVFERLGIAPPSGVLLHGPPGCGKTLIARTIAHEAEAHFYAISGPEIIHKFYGESEAHLRKIFEQASTKAPSIIFLDEIDAIAPRRDRSGGDVEKRVVATLLALMDGVNRRQGVIVIAATNIPNAIDPALRRPGRFDREIAIPIPDKRGRAQIFDVHSRGMPLAEDVDAELLAEVTHGFVGADLEARCRESSMRCLRRLLPDIDFGAGHIPYDRLEQLEVRMDDFQAALREVEASAIREVFVEVPNVRWSDIGGLSAVKQQLIEAVEWPLNYPELYEAAGVRPPKGVLLSGPPGCGKTMLAKAVAHESQVNFMAVKGPELLSKYVGESEEALREVFRKARQAAPVVLFFDEIDALLPTREGSSTSRVPERVLGQFLTEMDGIEELKGVLVLGATNRRDMLDPAVLRPGRFDALVTIDLPNRDARADIFQVQLQDKPLADPTPKVEWLASKTEGFSGAEIAAVCHGAALRALRRAVEGATDPEQWTSTGAQSIAITAADLEAAMVDVATRHTPPQHRSIEGEDR